MRASRLDWLVSLLLVPGALTGLAVAWYLSRTPSAVPLDDTQRAIREGLMAAFFALGPCLTGALMLALRRSIRRSVLLAALSGLAVPALLLLVVIVALAVAAAQCPPDAYECPF